MATDVVIAVGTRGVSGAVRSITRLEDRSSKLGKALAGAAAGGAVLATAAVGKFAVASVRAASASQQSVGATETVYGRFARTVIRESKRADDAIGLSANEYRELANVTGASLTAAGISLRKTTGLTADLNQRAADVAATFGGTTREAVEAFGSALRGETDPIERYGVAIKEADVSARLAAKGQDKLEGKAGKTAAMMARLDLIFEQTSKSQGAFARESDTLAGAQQRLDAKIENVQARFGKLLLPVLTDGVNLISRKVIPAAEDLAGWLEANQDEAEQLARAVADGVLPPLQTLGNVAAAAARFLSGLPPEVQSLAAQAAIAAVVLPRLNSAVAAASGTVGGFSGALRDAEKRTTALKNAARNAGGVGGLLLLAQGAQEADGGIRGLEMAAGGALTGLAVGGPWGAAIGGGAGLLASFATSSDKAAEAQGRLAAAQQRVIDTLNAQTGAYTKRTKAQLIDDMASKGMLETAKSLGLNLEQMAGVTMRGSEAIYRWRAAMAAKTSTNEEASAVFNLARNMLDLSGALQSGQRGWLLNAEAMGKSGVAAARVRGEVNQLGKRYGLLPREVRTIVRAMNADDSERSVRRLAKQYTETPRTIRTIFRLVGAAQAENEAKGTRKALEDAGRAKPDTAPWLRALESALTQGRGRAGRGAEGIARELGRGTRGARAELGPFRSSVLNQIATTKSNAHTGGSGVGDALGSGMYVGVDRWADDIASRAAGIVRAAVAAARNAADAHSPAGETIRLGEDLGAGLVVGLTRSRPKVKAAGFGMVDALVAGLSGQGDAGSPVDGAIDEVASKVERLYERRLNVATGRIGKHFNRLGKEVEQRFAANEKRLRKKLDGKAEDRALRRNENRQERAEQALARSQQLAERRMAQQIRADRKAALKIIEQATPALRANALAQAAINEQLEAARTDAAALREQYEGYVASVRDAVVAHGALSRMGEGDGFGSIEQLLAKRSAAVAEAARFSQVISQLVDAGLNSADIEDLMSRGVEGGLGTAEALLAGGPAVVAEMNRLASQLAATGTGLGTKVGGSLYGAGIQAADQLVAGLSAQQAAVAAEGKHLAAALDAALAAETALTAGKNRNRGGAIGRELVAGLLGSLDGNQAAVDKAARKLGNALVRAVKDELGIRSPSRVFRGIGDDVVRGLDIGLDDTYVKRSAATLAASLQKGFATPRLEAILSGGTGASSSAAPPQIIVQVPPTADKAAIGREIKQALDAYYATGGR